MENMTVEKLLNLSMSEALDWFEASKGKFEIAPVAKVDKAAINYEDYIEAINSEISANEVERDSAIKNGWFEKAAKLEIKNEGLKSAIFIASSGDYHLKP